MSQAPDTKRERRLAARAERQRMAAEGRKRAQLRRRLTIGGLVALVVAAIALLGFTVIPNLNRSAPGVAVPDEGRDHITAGAPLDYQNNPPASGPHYAQWAQPGVYTEAISPGMWVHSLEHGYVAVLYNCPEACPELVQNLRQFYDSAPRSQKYGYQKIVVTPYTDMEERIALVAWNRVLEMDTWDPEQAMAFYRAYLDKGPEDAR